MKRVHLHRFNLPPVTLLLWMAVSSLGHADDPPAHPPTCAWNGSSTGAGGVPPMPFAAAPARWCGSTSYSSTSGARPPSPRCSPPRPPWGRFPPANVCSPGRRPARACAAACGCPWPPACGRCACRYACRRLVPPTPATLTLSYDRIHQFGRGLPVNGQFDPSHVPDQVSRNAAGGLEWQGSDWRVGLQRNWTHQNNRQPGRVNADFETFVDSFSSSWAATDHLDAGVELS